MLAKKTISRALALVALTGLTSVASAATFIDNVTSIVIANASYVTNQAADGWLQVAEVQAFNGSGVDVIHGLGTTAMSSNPTAPPYGTTANLAIDNNFSTTYPNIYHATALGETLTITFATPQNLSSFSILGRNPAEYGSCCGHRNQFDVTFKTTMDTAGTTIYMNAQGANPVAAIPEPAEWTMMLGGFAMIGAITRRRQRMIATQS